MRFRAILFDLDGTLLDTLEDIADSANHSLHALGFPTHETSAYKRMVGDGMANLVRRALPEPAAAEPVLTECLRMVRQEYAKRWFLKTRPYEGIPELLEGLVAREMKMAILSNKPDDLTRLSVDRFLNRWRFDLVAGARPDVPLKPDPRPALEIARRLDTPPDRFAYLGDTGTDMQTARAAGMFGIGALWGFRSADELHAQGARELIHAPADLLALLE